MRLCYANPQAGTSACYNGNISEWQWQQGTDAEQLYGFTYDGVNRLKETSHKKKSGGSWVANANHYLEKGITYDRNGNILTLQRTGNGSPVDNLLYTYTGNQLSSLQEAVRTSLPEDIYLSGSTPNGTYGYDSDGNQLKDTRKGLEFSYNVLNLLHQVKKDNALKATYQYMANGTKLSVRNGNGNTGYDYDGSFVYTVTNNTPTLEAAHFAGGQLKANGVNYTLTDHLGSVRSIVDATGTIQEQNDYYPFGSKHVNISYASNDNRYTFNGKERQDLLDLNTYDFGARMHASDIARWSTVDPLCEDYYSQSLFNYCGNSVVKYADSFGMSLKLSGNAGDVIMALYNGIAVGNNVHLEFDDAYLDPFSIEKEALFSSDFFLRDLYEIAINPETVELLISDRNIYMMNGRIIEEDFIAPYDLDDMEFPEMIPYLKETNQLIGKHIVGNLGQTLFPGNKSISGKNSTNGNVQVIINRKGRLNHRTVGIAHEFGHVILYLRGLPFGHTQPGVDKFVYDERATIMSKRLGYDY